MKIDDAGDKTTNTKWLTKTQIIVLRLLKLMVNCLVLASTSTLNTVENKIPNVSALVKKIDNDVKYQPYNWH